jgi:hypothetical protein
MPRRIARPLLFGLTALSLLLWLATAALWVRSYWVADAVWWLSRRSIHALQTNPGRLEYSEGNTAGFLDYPFRFGHHVIRPPRHLSLANSGDPLDAVAWRFAGFAWFGGLTPDGYEQHALALPFWFVWLLTAVLPLRWFSTVRRRRRLERRRNANQCVACGYDLRASGDRCPECGQPSEPAPQNTAGAESAPAPK